MMATSVCVILRFMVVASRFSWFWLVLKGITMGRFFWNASTFSFSFGNQVV